jgi:predicted RNA-binding Zn-ribbon protein involved in translation (DUF1610 family)
MFCPYCEDEDAEMKLVKKSRKAKRLDTFKCSKCGHESPAYNCASEDDEEYW